MIFNLRAVHNFPFNCIRIANIPRERGDSTLEEGAACEIIERNDQMQFVIHKSRSDARKQIYKHMNLLKNTVNAHVWVSNYIQ